MTLPLDNRKRDLQYAADAMCEKAWRDAIKPTEATNDILYPGWRDELKREVEARRAENWRVSVDSGEGE